jgi:molybdate transport system substrate-binding protein
MCAALLAVLVSAAISLKGPLTEAAKQFDASFPGEPVTFTFGGSGELAAQIVSGAPVDVFFSASPVDMERVAAAGRIEVATRVAIARNRLVVIVPAGSAPPTELRGLLDPRFRRIAIGNVKTVPAGRYAKDALVASGVLGRVETRFVYGENVRQVIDLVARGEADAGFVYATDLPLGGDHIDLAFEISENLHKPIVYEGAVVAGAKAAARGREFLTFVTSAPGREMLVKRGFLPPGTTAKR